MKTLSAIVQTTLNCNLQCAYCSASAGERNDSMDLSILKEVLEKIVTREPESSTEFIWHGGEPLARGMDFFVYAMKIQGNLRDQGYRIDNAVQTNGTLITEKWAEFFKTYDFRVGVSIDGPKEINDKNRLFPNGGGTYEHIRKGTNILYQYGIKYNFLSVICNFDRKITNALVSFMRNESRGFKINVVTPIGRAKGPVHLTDGYSELFIELFEDWLRGGTRNFERSVTERFVKPLLTGTPHECTFLKDCQQSLIGVNPSGDVYPCARFMQYKEFCYGNIATNSFEEILNHPMRRLLTSRAESLTDCCEYKSVCNGGCPLNAYIAGDIHGKDYNCRQYHKIFSYIMSRLKEETKCAD